MTEKSITYSNLHITLSDLLSEMGYVDVAPPEEVAEVAQWVIGRAAEVAQPKFVYQVFPGAADVASSSVSVGGKNLDVGRIIASQLKDSEAFAVFVATAGVEYEQWRQTLDDSVKAYVADTLGTIIVERCADRMEDVLQGSIDKLQWMHTNRFSPGYCSWDVAQQHLLFELFEGTPCGVTLNSSSLMYPIKSVSGIIGLGRDVQRKDYTCHLCNFDKCYKRKNRLV